MKHRLPMLLATAGAVVLVVLGVATAGPGSTSSRDERRPVLVELFTSQGCSSCPSADAFLAQLHRVQPVRSARIVILSEHVDYWNDLGWVDPYSAAEFTTRQQEYATFFGNRSVYTPQMIVDGRREFVGSDQGAALRAISLAARERKLAVGLSWEKTRKGGDRRLRIEIDEPFAFPEGDVAEVWIALAENRLSTEIDQGENFGKRLDHAAVARSLRKVGRLEAGGFSRAIALQLQKGWVEKNVDALVFVQLRDARNVLGVASLSLNE